jgi:hypothetical protein
VPYAVFGDPQSLNLYGYVRNDPISRVDPDGHYEVNASGCNGNNQAKCQKKYDKATQRFEQARQKDLKSKDANVRAAATAYGAPGTKNGVHVGFESNRQMSAEYGSPIDGRVVAPRASNGKLKPIDLEVTISTDLRGKSLRREIAHEGSHVGDDIAFFTSYNFATGNFDANKNITHGQSEDEAFSVGAGVQKNFGFGPDDAVAIDRFVRGHYENYNVKLFPENSPDYPQQ